MFTASINASADLLTFYHPKLASIVTGTLNLTRENGCNSTVLPVNTNAATITNSSFTITPSVLYGVTSGKFSDGVYKFALTFNYYSGVVVLGLERIDQTTNTFCLVVDYDLKCKILLDNDPTVLKKYKSMFYSNDCDTCGCTHMCTIYNDLVQLQTTTNGTGNCGCN